MSRRMKAVRRGAPTPNQRAAMCSRQRSSRTDTCLQVTGPHDRHCHGVTAVETAVSHEKLASYCSSFVADSGT